LPGPVGRLRLDAAAFLPRELHHRDGSAADSPRNGWHLAGDAQKVGIDAPGLVERVKVWGDWIIDRFDPVREGLVSPHGAQHFERFRKATCGLVRRRRQGRFVTFQDMVQLDLQLHELPQNVPCGDGYFPVIPISGLDQIIQRLSGLDPEGPKRFRGELVLRLPQIDNVVDVPGILGEAVHQRRHRRVTGPGGTIVDFGAKLGALLAQCGGCLGPAIGGIVASAEPHGDEVPFDFADRASVGSAGGGSVERVDDCAETDIAEQRYREQDQ